MYKGLSDLSKYRLWCHCQGVQGADPNCATHGLSAIAQGRKTMWENAVRAADAIVDHLKESTVGENHREATNQLVEYRLDIASDIYRVFLNEEPTLAQIESYVA